MGAVLKDIAVQDDVSRDRTSLNSGESIPSDAVEPPEVDEVGAFEGRLDARRSPVRIQMLADAEGGPDTRISEDIANGNIGLGQELGLNETCNDRYSPESLLGQHDT